MTQKRRHVIPHNGNWAQMGAGNERVGSIHETQAEAIKEARRIARNNRGEVIIHGRDGRIRDADSYGNDPCPPKDRKH